MEDAACLLVNEDPEVYLARVPDGRYQSGATNCFIVRSGAETLLVDTGVRSAEGERLLREALETAGADLRRTACFLTHLHVDHMELLESVMPEGATVFVGTPEFDFMVAMRDEAQVEAMADRIASEGVGKAECDFYRSFKLGVGDFDERRYDVRLVDDGDVVTVGACAFSVVDTSGHAPGHRSLFHPESGLLVGGDHVLFVTSPYLSLYPGPRDRLACYLESLRRVRAKGVAKLLQAHGRLHLTAGPEGFVNRVDWLASHRERRVAEYEGVMRACPGLSGIDVIKSAPSSVVAETWESIPAIQRWCVVSNGMAILDHLARTGRAVVREDGRGIRRYWAE